MYYLLQLQLQFIQIEMIGQLDTVIVIDNSIHALTPTITLQAIMPCIEVNNKQTKHATHTHAQLNHVWARFNFLGHFQPVCVRGDQSQMQDAEREGGER